MFQTLLVNNEFKWDLDQCEILLWDRKGIEERTDREKEEGREGGKGKGKNREVDLGLTVNYKHNFKFSGIKIQSRRFLHY